MPELLMGLSDEEATRLVMLGRQLHLRPHEELFGLGVVAESIYVIRHGRVALTLPVQVGGREEDVLVEERGEGQAVGWSALIPPHRFTLRASALLDTEVLALRRQVLLEHFESCPSIGYRVLSNLAAVIGQRLQLFQTMWVREVQRVVQLGSV
jgi:CRP-like cAMP-binding protein